MNLKQLYIKTADYIERNPDQYNFLKTRVPECGSRGCVIGLMGMLHGGYAGRSIHDFAEEALGMTTDQLYNDFQRANMVCRKAVKTGPYTVDAQATVYMLRYLAAEIKDEKPLPDWNELATPDVLVA